MKEDDRVRIEGVGDAYHQTWVGVIYGLTVAGLDIRTSDGAAGLKWGKDHRWNGQPVDYVLTVAFKSPVNTTDTLSICSASPGQRPIASVSGLSRAEQAELDRLQFGRLALGGLQPSAERRALKLGDRAFRIVVFRGPEPCATG